MHDAGTRVLKFFGIPYEGRAITKCVVTLDWNEGSAVTVEITELAMNSSDGTLNLTESGEFKPLTTIYDVTPRPAAGVECLEA